MTLWRLRIPISDGAQGGMRVRMLWTTDGYLANIRPWSTSFGYARRFSPSSMLAEWCSRQAFRVVSFNRVRARPRKD